MASFSAFHTLLLSGAVWFLHDTSLVYFPVPAAASGQEDLQLEPISCVFLTTPSTLLKAVPVPTHIPLSRPFLPRAAAGFATDETRALLRHPGRAPLGGPAHHPHPGLLSPGRGARPQPASIITWQGSSSCYTRSPGAPRPPYRPSILPAGPAPLAAPPARRAVGAADRRRLPLRRVGAGPR